MNLEPKTPAEIKDYQFDWATELGSDTISDSSWAADDAALTVNSDSNSTTSATVFLGGGESGQEYKVTNTITTGGGRVLERSAFIGVVESRFAFGSHARTVLAAIEAVIERRATLDQQRYTIDGRSLDRTPLPDLMEMRRRYKAEVANQEREINIRHGKSTGRAVKVRF